VAEIRRLRPAIVMTFDRNGGYGHPDHIAIHHATMAAVDAAADPAHRPDLGPAHATPKVYVSATPRPVMARLNGIFVAHGFPAISFGAVQTIPNEELGTADGRVTTVIDVPDYVERKLAGMLAHRTQYGAQSPWATIPAAALAPVLGREWFVRIHPAPTGALPDEDDLLAGLPGGPA
jgi:N-acetyl-1-D-myo-inositol-2-amino-2-deoxy-alpha-D-glucopyranoside deacetylase